MNSSRAYWVVLAILTAAGLAIRMWHLENRPFHADESVHAFKLWDVYAHGRYIYDPDEYHGPTHYYATLPVLAARRPATFGDVTERDCRLGVAVLGGLTIPALALFAGVLRKRSVVIAAILLALSPAHVFYSRYFIQEGLLVLFTLLMLAAWMAYARAPSPWMAVAVGMAAGLMLATKETAVPTLALWLLTCAIVRSSSGAGQPATKLWSNTGIALVTTVVVAGVVLSHGFRNLAALPGYLHAFTPWLERAHGTDLHSHPWYYYLRMLVWHQASSGPLWTEPLLISLTFVGGVVAFLKNPERDLWPQRLVLFTILLLVMYSTIPYKTPWCILTPVLGLSLCAGFGGAWLLDAHRPAWLRWSAAIAIALGTGHAAKLAYDTSFRYQTRPANPYTYAQTVPDAQDIQKRADALAAVHPQGYRMVVKVIWNDPYYWPIPWYLRRFENVGYYQGVPDDPFAPLVLAAPLYDEQLTAKLDATHLMNGYIGLRPHVVTQVWVDFELWKRYIETRQARQRKDDMP